MQDVEIYDVSLILFGPTLFAVYEKFNQNIVNTTKKLLNEEWVVIATNNQNCNAKFCNAKLF
jgi:hypothetical protein